MDLAGRNLTPQETVLISAVAEAVLAQLKGRGLSPLEAAAIGAVLLRESADLLEGAALVLAPDPTECRHEAAPPARLSRVERARLDRTASSRRAAQGIDRAAIMRRDGYRCRYCGTKGNGFAIDHVVPFSRGGTAEPSNLVTACKSCNSRKKNRTPEEAGMQILPRHDLMGGA